MLAYYRDDARVGMVSGDNFRPREEWRKSGHELTIFTFIWGWATWRRAWRCYDGGLSDWPERRRSDWLRLLLGRSEAAAHWVGIFDDCHRGNTDTWVSPWSYSCWKAGYLCVVPGCNLISNIGIEGRGRHTVASGSPNVCLPVSEIALPLASTSVPRRDRRLDEFYLSSVYGVRLYKWRKRARLALREWRARAVVRISWWMLPMASERTHARRMVGLLKTTERFKSGRSELDGIEWTYPDAPSFAYAYEQIFLRAIYDMGAIGVAPRIIDCGANIGLATLYWKRKYPDAEVVAVEADPVIYRYLADNLARAGVSGVRALNQAVWHSVGELSFAPQGADAGRLVSADAILADTIRVPAVPLSELLGNAPVDLLKMDIEGAECEVLVGQEEHLGQVRRIFVEYHSYTGKPQRLDELLGTLRRAGFRVQIHAEFVSPRPFVSRQIEDGMDHRLNLYAWRD